MNLRPNVFRGPRAAFDRLQLGSLPRTAMIELDRTLNPFRDEGVRMYAKVMSELPWSQIKIVVAVGMLQAAQEAGQLDGVHTLVEATSGNTGSSLAIVAPWFGIRRVVVVVARDLAPGKIHRLVTDGAELEYCADGEPGCDKARRLGRQDGWLNLGQYDSAANVHAHRAVTAAQIHEDLGDELTLVCAGMGTAGTILGCKSFFDDTLPHVKTVGVLCAPGEDGIPGMRTRDRLREIGLRWDSVPFLQEVTMADAYRTSRAFIRAGIECGPSSGAAAAGGRQLIARHLAAGTLDAFRHERTGEVTMAIVCPDNHLPYLDKYAAYAAS